ncbi:MAG TPA: hypothetical protein VK152_09375 [Paludibacter sp.]|nr:hypothetical protein [Paludibacter sp.]
MEELIESLIKRLEIQRTECMRIIENSEDDFYNTTKNIQTGKIIAFNVCINELQQILGNQE